MPHSIKGFTILELIIVILLISTISVMVIISWPGDSLNLDGKTEQLARDIRFTQALAMHGEQFDRINFLATAYRISNSIDTTPYPGYNNVPLGGGITLAATLPNLVFNILGVPSNGGAAIAAVVTLTLTAPDGSNKQITVNPETGLVTVL